jgi:hypothetical protein
MTIDSGTRALEEEAVERRETGSLSLLFASRLALVASLSILAGTGLFVLSMLVDRGSAEPWFSCVLIFALAPVLGLLAAANLACHWRRGKTGLDARASRKLGRRFGRAAVLFALVGLLTTLTVPPAREWIDHMILAHAVDIWFAMPAILAVLLGGVSLSLLSKSDAVDLGRLGALSAMTIGLGVVIVPFAVPFGFYLRDVASYRRHSMSFSGSSSRLKETTVVATLDCPLPAGKNVIWCSSFQLAWNTLRDNIVGGPVLLTGAGDLADRLNSAKGSQDDLDASSYFITAALADDNVQKRIATEMARRFSSASAPTFSDLGSDDLVMYAYLEAEAEFRYPFENDRNGMEFRGSNGRKKTVASFGVWDDSPRYDKLREQVQVLYHSFSSDPNASSSDPNRVLPMFLPEIDEFAVDLCRHTQPYQIVLARIDPAPTLAQTLAELNEKIARFAMSEAYDELKRLDEADRLFVPEMFWEVEHRFADLEGKKLANLGAGGAPIKLAEQLIRFRLDRCGAVLKSRVSLVMTLGISRARTFSFDQPFLVYMKKRDANQPFFVMWVDNAELLTCK